MSDFFHFSCSSKAVKHCRLSLSKVWMYISDWLCKLNCKPKVENGMLRHSFGGAVIFISLQHFILPNLQAIACKGSNKGSNFKEVENK